MSYLIYSTKIAKYLVKKTNLTKEKEEVLAYAIEVLSLNLLNVGLTVLIGYLLGVLPGTLVCLLTVFAVRTFSGGAHSDSPWRCAAITALIFPIMALLAKQTMAFINPISIDIFLAASFITSLFTAFVLAPVDSPSAPIISVKRRRKLKLLSMLSLTIIGVIAVLSRYGFITGNTELHLCIAFGALWSSFILTPIGHSFFRAFDGLKY